MNYRKKLIEVALPLEAINVASAREKSIRHGHPSTLHLWWARRPLASCRAVLFASLVDDPSSDPMYAGDDDIEASKRAELFNLIEELVQWDNSNNIRVINKARAEIARCIASRKIETGEFKKQQTVASGATAHDIKQMLAPSDAVNEFLAHHAPPVFDPFCGGGSIPLEAQRLGLCACASDLNPVAVLISKALIEIPPRFAGIPPINPTWQKKSPNEQAATVWTRATGLAEDVRYYGLWLCAQTKERIGQLYPKVRITSDMAKDRTDLKTYVGEELTVIAWLWARTVASPNPACKGAHVPLLRSYWLSTKKGKEAWVRTVIDTTTNSYRFEVNAGKPQENIDPRKGTVVRTGATCLLTGSPIPFDYIRNEGKAGRMGQRLLAIVVEGRKERLYISALDSQVKIAESIKPTDYPETELPQQALSIRVMLYGMDKHYKLFTSRQLTLLNVLGSLVRETRDKVALDAGKANRSHFGLSSTAISSAMYADAVATYLGEAVSKTTAFHCTLASWRVKEGKSARAFGRQSIPMVWDFAEVNPFADAGGALEELIDSASKTIAELPASSHGEAVQRDATSELESQKCIISTDPPYYDNVGYADLSDFYYAWLRRALEFVYPNLFSTVQTPKVNELIATPFRHRGNRDEARHFFEDGLRRAFLLARNVHDGEYPLTIYYGFKQTEADEDEDEDGDKNVVSTGWETILEGITSAGFCITGTWPMRTESVVGLKNAVNALASSIILVCRSRRSDAPLATRKEFLNALRKELPDSLRNLQRGNIAPVDLAQASIGPGMAVFTRYSKVMETDGSAMTVRIALGLINQALDEVLAEQEGEFDTDTRWALAWFEQFGMDEGPFGVAETLSKAKNTSVNGLVEAGVVKARAGKVQLLTRDELPDDWNPATDKRLTVWEVTQHLIRIVETKGESAAAVLLHQLGGMGEIARDLAYRLYVICERKKWAEEAMAYNGLVIAWSELSKLALSERTKSGTTQTKMFD